MEQTTRDKHNAYHRQYQKRRYRERMAEAHERLGGSCARCGSTDRLHIDHIDPRSKVKSLSSFHNYTRAKWEAELAKCQLLCSRCHGFKTGVIDQRHVRWESGEWHSFLSSCLGG